VIDVKDLAKPEAAQAFLELAQKRLDPHTVAIVKKVKTKIDQMAKSAVRH